MNVQTAEHLNYLRDRARPVELSSNCVPTGDVLFTHGQVSAIAQSLSATIDNILAANESAIVAAEIRDAAHERREASVLHVAFSPYWWHSHDEIPWDFTRRLWIACRPQIEAAIAADNAVREAEYEAYRLACEQGVAIPPRTM